MNKLNRFRLPMGLLAALMVGVAHPGNVDAREMRVSSFEPPSGFYSEKVLQAWIDDVNPKLSDGNRFRLYAGSTLGAPPAQAELVEKGVADVALVVPTYTPGLFPGSSVMELPGLATTSKAGTDTINTLAEEGLLDDEYGDYKVIALFTTPGYRLLMTEEGVTRPEDLRGKRLRTPSPFGGELISMMGGSGVSIPAPQVYENLERDVVSGAIWVFDAYQTFRLYEVAPHIVNLRMTASPMAVLMNRNTYQSLPEEDRRVIDEMSGRATAEWIAEIVDTHDREIEQHFRDDEDVTVIDPDSDARATWESALEGAEDVWLDGHSDSDLARTILDRALEITGNR